MNQPKPFQTQPLQFQSSSPPVDPQTFYVPGFEGTPEIALPSPPSGQLLPSGDTDALKMIFLLSFI